MTLRTGSLELELDPAAGAISRLSWVSGAPVPVLADSTGRPGGGACLPLVPLASPIRGGCFTFRGQEIRVPSAPRRSNSWRVESSTDEEASLLLVHQPGEWPWAFEARQSVRLAGDSLWLELACRNASEEPMPCGLGFRPALPCGPQTRIQTFVDEVWRSGNDMLSAESEAPAGRFDISDSLVCGTGVEACYGGWCGRALFTDPDWPFELELSSPEARFLQLGAPEGGGHFVAAPASHAIAALNSPQAMWASLGIQVLAPGEEAGLQARLQVQPK